MGRGFISRSQHVRCSETPALCILQIIYAPLPPSIYGDSLGQGESGASVWDSDLCIKVSVRAECWRISIENPQVIFIFFLGIVIIIIIPTLPRLFKEL